jgi:small subunit ribosomal protein S8
VKADAFERWERSFLPSKEIGILVVSTPRGVTSHKVAKDEKTGGRLLAFVY